MRSNRTTNASAGWFLSLIHRPHNRLLTWCYSNDGESSNSQQSEDVEDQTHAQDVLAGDPEQAVDPGSDV
jgi:hypothetical protein